MITDEQIIYDALRRYTLQRQTFYTYVITDGNLREDGEEFTKEEIADAMQVAKQCDRLTQQALARLKKAQSPIVLLN